MRSRGLLFFACLFFIHADVVDGQPRPPSLQYLSPRPGAQLVSRETNVIVRFHGGFENRVVDLAAMFSVAGSTSGKHSGEAAVSDDGETIVFKPHRAFAPGETVSVTLDFRENTAGTAPDPYTFDFVVSPKRLKPEPTLPSCITEKRVHTGAAEIMEAPDRAERQTPRYTLPSDFPPITVSAVDNPGEGQIFLTNFVWKFPDPPPSHLLILDNTGTPVFFRKSDSFVLDFKKQRDGLLSFFEFHPWGHVFMDSTYTPVDTCRCGNGYVVDSHDVQVLDNGHYLVICQDEQIVDMSEVIEGGHPSAKVVGMIFQELDRSKNVVFEWRSWDHFEITDAIGVDFTNERVDYVHSNALVQDADGNLLASNRHLSEITKIDRSTGDVIWRLGGKNNQFHFVGDIDDSTGFHYQHDIRRLPNGNVTLFDNGNFHNPAFSRAVEYRLDTQSMTATLVWQHRNTPDIYADFMGSAQRLPGGNTVISWGGSHYEDITTLTEVHPDGTKAFELTFTDGTLNYKGYRFPWSGTARQPLMWAGEFDKRRRTLTLNFDKFGDENVGQYVLYVGVNSEPLAVWDSTTTNTTDIAGLNRGIDYNFRIRADDSRTSDHSWSNEVSFRYENTEPTAVELVGPPDGSGLGTATVELSWTSAVDAENDSLTYTVHVFGSGDEMTIENIVDTFYVYTATGATPLPDFGWTVSSADYEFKTASPDTFKVTSSGIGFGVPATHSLHQNYPNPFNPGTNIRYDLPRSEFVTLRIYNVLGQEVKLLLDADRPAGFWSITWDGRNDAGSPVGSGVYLYKLQTPSFTETKKMTLVH
jgi:hypothetical protein